MKPSYAIKKAVTRRTIRDFSDKVGLVYFGFVDQRDDEHRLVRGHTVSSTHMDNHYAVGSVRGYDVAVVLRNDIVVTKQRKENRVHWLIITIDLQSSIELPRVYVGHKSRELLYEASGGILPAIYVPLQAQYPHKFQGEYVIHGKPTHAVEVGEIINAEAAQVIGEHFGGASVEIEDNTMYLYIESQRPTEALLEKMLSNGLWLAETMDTAMVRKRAEAN